MKLDLNQLRTEILDYMSEKKFAVFHSMSRAMQDLPTIFWNSEARPSFREFLETAEALGVRMIVFHHREFSPQIIDDALESISETDLPPSDQRSMERRLREIRKHVGSTCVIELSYDLDNRVYAFELRTDWYDEASNIVGTIDAALMDEGEEEEDEGPLGGYFSRN